VRTNKRYEPIPANAKTYEELYGIFCDIYEALNIKAFGRLAAIQNKTK
jgi:hypothetical protein